MIYESTMTRSLTKTIHICFGGIITASFLHFMGYFNYINHVKPVDKGVIQYRALEINKNNTEDVKMEGFPIMNTSIYNWHPKDLIRMPIPNYLPGMKTPCFFVEDDGSSEHSKGAVRVNDTLVLRCFPQLLLIGCERCATGGMFSRLTLHRHILYPFLGNRALKDPLFFNGVVGMDLHKKTVGGYLQLMNNATKIIYENCMKGMTVTPPKGYKECPYILIDCTSRTMNHNWFWHKDLENQGLPEPNILVPHKVYRLNPKMKIVAMLRNPPDRLYSDYTGYPSSHDDITTPEDFHKRVVGEIAVWNQCLITKRLPLNRCAYGFNWPEGFSGGKTVDFWSEYSLDRLRVGIYFVYLKDWIKVFPRENILVLTTEEYALGPLDFIRKVFLPFAELEDFREHDRRSIESWDRIIRGSNRRGRKVMLNKTRETLEKFYQPYNLQLAELLGDNKYLWSEYLQFVR